MDELDPGRVSALREHLRACSAQVYGVGGTRGSGFFVSDQLLLTCAHVANGKIGDRVEVKPAIRDRRGGTIKDIREDPSIDLALIDVDPVEGETPLAAVVLDRQLSTAVYSAVGYPKDSLGREPELEVIDLKAHQRGTDYLVIEAGQARITSGLSGAPLLNPVRGAVAAVVQFSEAVDEDAGGGGIGISLAGDHFAEIRELLDEPADTAVQWRETLGQEAWQRLGKPWIRRRSYDIVVTGSTAAWQVKLDDDSQEITVRDLLCLPDDVSNALFSWAQRRRARREEEVKLLGRLLAAAVLPPGVASRIGRGGGLELRIRLLVDGASTLFDVPWEFITVAGENGDRHVAAEKGMEFVRVGPHASPESVSTLPGSDTAGVVGVVIQPRAWQKKMPTFAQAGDSVEWPKEQHIMRELRQTVETAQGLTFLTAREGPLENPGVVQFYDELDRALPDGVTLEVVHYIGFGRMERDGPELAFMDDEIVVWHSLADICAKVADSGARVLVVELALPRADLQLDPIPPNAYLGALDGRVNAVVFTRFPLHPRQFKTFNGVFYRELGKGATVEGAVSQGRRELHGGTHFLGDAATFGWFTLVTGPSSDMRLRTTPGPEHQDAARQELAEPAMPARTEPRTTETFVRSGS